MPRNGEAARRRGTISVRGPEEMVRRCRARIISEAAAARVSESVDVDPAQRESLSGGDAVKRISRLTNAHIVLNETSVKIIGVGGDVRDAKINIEEHLTGVRYFPLSHCSCFDSQFILIHRHPAFRSFRFTAAT